MEGPVPARTILGGGRRQGGGIGTEEKTRFCPLPKKEDICVSNIEGLVHSYILELNLAPIMHSIV